MFPSTTATRWRRRSAARRSSRNPTRRSCSARAGRRRWSAAAISSRGGAGRHEWVQHRASPHREEPPQGGVSNGETRSASAPQDEEDLLMPLRSHLILRSADRARLEGRTINMQPAANYASLSLYFTL